MTFRRIVPSAVLALAAAMPAAAQTGGNASVASIRPLYDMVKGWAVKGAEMMPESSYAWQPTTEIRTFGQLIGHIANSNWMFCSSALGEENPNRKNFEAATTKAELVKAIRDATTYCDRAYQMTDAKALEPLQVFGVAATRLYALNFNTAHDFEHYGNMVTYLRLKGLVPPSSAGSGM